MTEDEPSPGAEQQQQLQQQQREQEQQQQCVVQARPVGEARESREVRLAGRLMHYLPFVVLLAVGLAGLFWRLRKPNTTMQTCVAPECRQWYKSNEVTDLNCSEVQRKSMIKDLRHLIENTQQTYDSERSDSVVLPHLHGKDLHGNRRKGEGSGEGSNFWERIDWGKIERWQKSACPCQVAYCARRVKNASYRSQIEILLGSVKDKTQAFVTSIQQPNVRMLPVVLVGIVLSGLVGGRILVYALFAILWLLKWPDRVRWNYILASVLRNPDAKSYLDCVRYKADQNAAIYLAVSLSMFGILYIDYHSFGNIFFPWMFQQEEVELSRSEWAMMKATQWFNSMFTLAGVAGVGWWAPWTSLMVWLVPPLILITALLLLIAAVGRNAQVSRVLGELQRIQAERGERLEDSDVYRLRAALIGAE